MHYNDDIAMIDVKALIPRVVTDIKPIYYRPSREEIGILRGVLDRGLMSKSNRPLDDEGYLEVMLDIEKEVIKRGSSKCGGDVAGVAGMTRYGIDGTLFQAEVDAKSGFSTMSDTGCLIDSLVYQPLGIQYDLTMIDNIKAWITKLKLIGDPSVEGYALAAGPDVYPDMFVIKTARNVKQDTLPHEALIGFSLNWTRRHNPNFAFTYSLFSCSPLVLDGGNVISWCDADGGSNYLVLENIRDAVTICDYVKTCNIEEFVDVYIQVLSALDDAGRMFAYTHNDLHYKNVLVRRLGYKLSVKYDFDDKTSIYVNSDKVGTIIDHGLSRMQLGEGIFFRPDFREYGFRRFFPMFDAYKLLCYCASSAKVNNRIDLLAAMDRMYAFFNETEYDDVLGTLAIEKRLRANAIKPNFFALDGKYRKVPMKDYIKHVLTLGLSGNITSAPIAGALLYVGRDDNHFDLYMASIVNPSYQPKTLKEVCMTALAIDKVADSQKEKQAYRDMSFNGIDINAMFNTESEAMIGELTATQASLASLVFPELFRDQPIAFTSYYVRRYREVLTFAVKLLSTYSKASLWVKTAHCVAGINLLDHARLNEAHDLLTKCSYLIATMRSRLQANQQYIKANKAYIYDINVQDFYTKEHELYERAI